jgi:hypothetical protein
MCQKEKPPKAQMHAARKHKIRAKADMEKVRQKNIYHARAELDEDETDTAEERIRRAEARKFLMRYESDIWGATKSGALDILKKFFLVGSSSRYAICNASEHVSNSLSTSYGTIKTLVRFDVSAS